MFAKRILPIACLAAAISVQAAVKLPSFISDNMVVQHNSALTIPGTAAPDARIEVTSDWLQTPVTARAAADGKFRVTIPTPEAGGPYTIIIKEVTPDGSDITALQNVLSGEVWLAGGQSNMEYPVKGWTEVIDGDRVTGTSQHPDIRLLRVKKHQAFKPQEDAELMMGWSVASPASMDFSAIGYLFGLRLHDELGVPVGIIDSTWGGTPVEGWTAYEYLKGIPGFENELRALEMSGFEKEGAEKAYSTFFEEWKKQLDGIDDDFDKSVLQSGGRWGEMPIPGIWEGSVLPDFDGQVWLQTAFVLPDSLAGKPMQLNLGAIDNLDVTYLNGTEIGCTDMWYQPRSYAIDSTLVKAGENVISIRVLDFDGAGGINAAPEAVCAVIGDVTVPLAGNWRYLQGPAVNQLPRKPSTAKGTQYPTLLYNAMIAPLQVLPIKGTIWYQGCSNVGRADQYALAFPSMIRNWRHLFGEDMPFYFVQISSFGTQVNVQPESEWALLREAQEKALALPNTAMVVTTDLGHPTDIHPSDKGSIADRLSDIALTRDYGKKYNCDTPALRSMKGSDEGLILTFDMPVKPQSKAITGFIIGDKDGKFAVANVKLNKKGQLVASSPLIPQPTEIRYNWADYAIGNLYGESGLPVAPFRAVLPQQ